MGFCAFTDASSTRDNRVVSDCRKYSKRGVQIECTFCCPGKTITRCTNCYTKFQRTIARRRAELEKQSGGMVFETPALRAMRLVDFDGLEKRGECSEEASEFIEPTADNMWRWRIPCPSCYSFTVPSVEQCMPIGFGQKLPELKSEVIDLDVPMLDKTTGQIGAPRPVRLEVVSAAAVMSHEESKHVRFRAADLPAHDNYATFWRPPPPADGYKVNTIISSMDDVELHELHGVFHAGRAQPRAPQLPPAHAPASKRARKRKVESEARECIAPRGCWRRRSDEDGCFYEDGVGIADWLSKYN